MGKNWRFSKVAFNGKWSDSAWNSEQKSILQQVLYLNTQRNTALGSLKYCQFEYDWCQILSKS